MSIRGYFTCFACLLVLPLLALSCEDQGIEFDPEYSDGDVQQESDLDAEVTDSITLKGSSTTGGNAIVFLSFHAINTSSFIEWSTIDIKIDSAFLPDAPACDNTNGERLVSEVGVVSLSMLEGAKPRLKLIAPEDKDYCSLDFNLPSHPVALHAEGSTANPDGDRIGIVIDTDLSGLLPFIAKTGKFRWASETEYQWVAVLDLEKVLDDDLLTSLAMATPGEIRVDNETNAGFLGKINENIIGGFSILNDLNENGQADAGEQTGENTVGYGRIDGDCPSCAGFAGDYCFDSDASTGGSCETLMPLDEARASFVYNPADVCGYHATIYYVDEYSEPHTQTVELQGCNLSVVIPLVMGTCESEWNGEEENIVVDCPYTNDCSYVFSKSACDLPADECLTDDDCEGCSLCHDIAGVNMCIGIGDYECMNGSECEEGYYCRPYKPDMPECGGLCEEMSSLEDCLYDCGDGCFLTEHMVCGADGQLWCPCEMACYGIAEADDPSLCAGEGECVYDSECIDGLYCDRLMPQSSYGTCQSEFSGVCVDALEGGACYDGDPCTGGDACQSGFCVGSPIDCDHFLGTYCPDTENVCEYVTNITVENSEAICKYDIYFWLNDEFAFDYSLLQMEGCQSLRRNLTDIGCSVIYGDDDNSFEVACNYCGVSTFSKENCAVLECVEDCGDGCFQTAQKVCGEDGQLWCPCEMACHGILEAEDPIVCDGQAECIFDGDCPAAWFCDRPLEQSAPGLCHPPGSGECADVPCLIFDPEFLDFGCVEMGQSKIMGVTLSNAGGADLEILNISLSTDSHLQFVQVLSLPITLSQGERITLYIEYTPVTSGQLQGALTIETDMDDRFFEIPIAGDCTGDTDGDTDSDSLDCADLPYGTPCDDGDPCTLGDVCQGGFCFGAPINCDDGNPGTLDTCEDGQCAYEAIPDGDEDEMADPCLAAMGTYETYNPDFYCAGDTHFEDLSVITGGICCVPDTPPCADSPVCPSCETSLDCPFDHVCENGRCLFARCESQGYCPVELGYQPWACIVGINRCIPNTCDAEMYNCSEDEVCLGLACMTPKRVCEDDNDCPPEDACRWHRCLARNGACSEDRDCAYNGWSARNTETCIDNQCTPATECFDIGGSCNRDDGSYPRCYDGMTVISGDAYAACAIGHYSDPNFFCCAPE